MFNLLQETVPSLKMMLRYFVMQGDGDEFWYAMTDTVIGIPSFAYSPKYITTAGRSCISLATVANRCSLL